MSAPEGWKLVPIEPTEAMIEAICTAPRMAGALPKRSGQRIYRAMLSSAPLPPVEDGWRNTVEQTVLAICSMRLSTLPIHKEQWKSACHDIAERASKALPPPPSRTGQ